MADTFFFLKLNGIEGESQTFDGQIDVLSFSEGVSNAGSYDAGTGGNTGQSSFAEVTISKNTDKSSPTLRQFCALGTAIDTATISCYKQAGDNQLLYLKITLHNVVITSIQGSGTGGSTEPIPEVLSLDFAKIEYDYTQQSNTGDALGTIHFGYDVQQHRSI